MKNEFKIIRTKRTSAKDSFSTIDYTLDVIEVFQDIESAKRFINKIASELDDKYKETEICKKISMIFRNGESYNIEVLLSNWLIVDELYYVA